MIIEKIKEKLIYTEKGYETLNVYNIKINDIEYKNYYVKGNLTEKHIIDNINYITFVQNKFIGEIKDNKIIDNKYILEQIKEDTEKDKRILEIYRKSNFLKNKAFLEVYFSTHYVPDLVKYEYVEKNNIKNYENLDNIIKNEFRGKALEFNKKIKEVEEKRHLIYLNLEEIGKYNLDVLQNILNKIDIHILGLEEKNKLKLIQEKLRKTNILKIKERKEIKEYIINNNKKFDEEKSLEYITSYINLNYKYDLVKEKNIYKIKNIIKKEIELKKLKTKELELKNQKILKTETNLYNNIDEYLESLNFDDLYEYVEKGDYNVNREEFTKEI